MAPAWLTRLREPQVESVQTWLSAAGEVMAGDVPGRKSAAVDRHEVDRSQPGSRAGILELPDKSEGVRVLPV